MSTRDVPIREESIRLGQFLKLADLIDNGADAKPLMIQGVVSVNGETETRRGRRLVKGDVVVLDDQAGHVRSLARAGQGEVRVLAVRRQSGPALDVAIEPDPQHAGHPRLRRERAGPCEAQRQRVAARRPPLPSAELTVDLVRAALAEELTRQVPARRLDPAQLGMRRSRGVDRLVEMGLDLRRERDGREETFQRTSTRSTTKIRVSPGAITGGAPRSPYARWAGMTSCRRPPTFMPWMPWSQPEMT